MHRPLDYIIPEDCGEVRLDRQLAQGFPEHSRARLQALIRNGAVEVDREVVRDPAYRVKPGLTVTLTLPDLAPAAIAGDPINLTIIHEDADVLVVDKPAGLVVHPAAGHTRGTLVNALIAHCGESLSGIGGISRPGIVHRLDKGTSGLMVIAKNDRAHRCLSEQFASHGADGRLKRAYIAICWGAPSRPRGRINARLGRSSANRKKIAVVSPAIGRFAATRYEVARVYTGTDARPVASQLRLELETGRTHQIRVHLTHIGHPVLADPIYGTGYKASSARLGSSARDALDALERQALHATELGFQHPVSGSSLSFRSDLPSDMSKLVAALDDGNLISERSGGKDKA